MSEMQSVPIPGHASAVAAGAEHCLVVANDLESGESGCLWGFGENREGQTGVSLSEFDNLQCRVVPTRFMITFPFALNGLHIPRQIDHTGQSDICIMWR